MAGLDLSSAAGFAKGSDNGPIVKLVGRGDARHSRLLRVISYEEAVKMPPAGKLSAEEIANFRAWVEMGAPWPRTQPAALKAESHWAFQPVQPRKPPAVKAVSWVKSPIDRFILAKLEQRGLQPARPASKAALLRRVTFDLTGLPPTEEELKAFLTDASPRAFARVVDRLLASPRYGEKWGRHWLDVARYADSTGVDEDHLYFYGWRYRDYVIEAFNQDLPYDPFVAEQVAGDLLPAEAGAINRRGIVATGFLALGPKPLAQQDRARMVYDVIDEQIDTTSKAFLGLTIACARCHDHKFDPISTRDYYSLAGIFASSKNFRDLGRPGGAAVSYLATLEPEAQARYQAHRKRMYAKQMEMEQALAEKIASPDARQYAWQSFCRALLASNEFVFVE